MNLEQTISFNNHKSEEDLEHIQIYVKGLNNRLTQFETKAEKML